MRVEIKFSLFRGNDVSVLVALQDYPIAYQKVNFAPLPPQASVCPRTILYSEDYSALLDIAVNYVATLFSPKLTYFCLIRNPFTLFI